LPALRSKRRSSLRTRDSLMSEGVFAMLLAGLVVAVLAWVFWKKSPYVKACPARKEMLAGTVSLLEAEAYVALLKFCLFVFTAFHFPVGRTYSFSSAHDFFSSEACIASSWVNGGVQ
jgi:hypothetical protein